MLTKIRRIPVEQYKKNKRCFNKNSIKTNRNVSCFFHNFFNKFYLFFFFIRILPNTWQKYFLIKYNARFVSYDVLWSSGRGLPCTHTCCILFVQTAADRPENLPKNMFLVSFHYRTYRRLCYSCWKRRAINTRVVVRVSSPNQFDWGFHSRSRSKRAEPNVVQCPGGTTTTTDVRVPSAGFRLVAFFSYIYMCICISLCLRR